MIYHSNRLRFTSGVASVLALVLLWTSGSAAYVRPGHAEVVSVSTAGGQGDSCETEGQPAGQCSLLAGDLANPWGSSMSDDGRFVAFTSDATGLADPDSNGLSDVFVRDRTKTATEIASISSDGSGAIGPPGVATTQLYNESARVDYLSYDPSISADGRYVAFASDAINLVSGDTNLATDVFVRDVRSGVTERVSVTSSGEQGFELIRRPDSFYPSMSSDGRFVSFTSWASNFDRSDTNGFPDVFVHDRATGNTERVSVNSQGMQSAMRCGPEDRDCVGRIWFPHSSINATGRWVAFDSDAPDLVPDDTNASSDVFVKDRQTGAIERVSVDSHGDQTAPLLCALCSESTSSLSGHPSAITNGRNISADGRYVVFASRVNDLVPSDTNDDYPIGRDGMDIFVHDRKTGRTERISVSSQGEQPQVITELGGVPGSFRGVPGGSAANVAPSMSPDGRYIVWHTVGLAQSLVDADAEGVFLHDRMTGATEFVSWMLAHVNRDDFTGMADVSATGRYVSFASPAWHDEGSQDRNPGVDIFVRDRGSTVGAYGWEEPSTGEPPTDDRICISPEVCIPPGGVVTAKDEHSGALNLTERGADLIDVSLAYRPQFEDVFTVIELDSMPSLPFAAPGISSQAGSATTMYGMRFTVDDRRYEVRATSWLGGTFGLFECGDSRVCTKVADLRGGYGTTGMRVVFSLPLRSMDLQDSDAPRDVEVFSALGVYDQPLEIRDRQILDRVAFDHR